MINILHMSPWSLGGSTSYVVNLQQTLAAAGVPHRVVRIRNRTERAKRELGSYGTLYQNVSFDDAQRGKGVWLLASAPTDKIAAAQCVELVAASGGAYVFHDPNEFGIYPHWQFANRERVICIRETGLDTMPQGTFIPHPYVRTIGHDGYHQRSGHAISVSRISAVKHSDWILAANQRLPFALRVDLVGELNRMWWRFNIEPKHPEWEKPPSTSFPRERGRAAAMCAQYQYMVDMTVFKNDGGGTQYTLLEAMDAGAVPVMTKDWCGYPGVARDLGFAVADAEALYEFLLAAGSRKPIARQADAYRQHNYEYLNTVHAPATIAAQYAAYLGV